MIRARSVTKKFTGRVAIDQISFDIDAHEIVGLLGSNGAGKTTMMRMLAGYLMPDEGEIEIAGFSPFNSPIEMKRQVGYLPEQCPLYGDMRVDEYLKYRACLKGVPSRQLKERLFQVKDQCALGNVSQRIIGQLSKGYRQRIGLADTLIHQPKVLILDEPTVGLDPHQIRHIRTLISDLSSEHTILISTHIMQEVEAICERVMVIRDGRLLVTEPLASSTDQDSQKYLLEIAATVEEVEAQINQITSIQRGTIEAVAEKVTRVEVELLDAFTVNDLFDWVVSQGWRLHEMHQVHASLEERFIDWVDQQEKRS